MMESGLLQGVAPGQAGMGPGGRPDLQGLIARIGGDGNAEMGASVMRRKAI
jgi:hypothetical protein